jgi:predicted RNA-binding Zn ribbon-like protein
MTVDWTKHRFSGGALVYDLINTVVHRQNPARQADRLADPAEVSRFANAALAFREEEVRHYNGRGPDVFIGRGLLLEVREAAYEYFQPSDDKSPISHVSLARLLGLIAKALDESVTMPFAADVALSALNQITPSRQSRLKACPKCDWLFLDKSKNGSRIWCDMAVCGNRQKARRCYLKRSSKKEVLSEIPL